MIVFHRRETPYFLKETEAAIMKLLGWENEKLLSDSLERGFFLPYEKVKVKKSPASGSGCNTVRIEIKRYNRDLWLNI